MNEKSRSTIRWQGPFALSDHRSAPKGPGIYAIGCARDSSEAVTACDEVDPYMFNWPNNLAPLYVGISESLGEGIRRRIRSHGRGTGNKDIAARLKAGEHLWFVAASGTGLAGYEALFLCLKNDTAFGANTRSENRRFAIRLNAEIEADMRANGIDPDMLPVFDEDYYRDG